MKFFLLELSVSFLLSVQVWGQEFNQVCAIWTKGSADGVHLFTGTLIDKGNYILTVSHPFLVPYSELHVKCGRIVKYVPKVRVVLHSASSLASPKGVVGAELRETLQGQPVIVNPVGDLALIKLNGILTEPIPAYQNVRLSKSMEEATDIVRKGKCTSYGYGPPAGEPALKTSLRQRPIDISLGDQLAVSGIPKTYVSDPNHFFIYPPGVIRVGDVGAPVLCPNGAELVVVGVVRGVLSIKVDNFDLSFAVVEHLSSSLDWINRESGT